MHVLVQDRHGYAAENSTEGHKDGERTGTPVLSEKAGRTGAFLPEEEKAKRESYFMCMRT